jgi:hypothetical protein
MTDLRQRLADALEQSDKDFVLTDTLSRRANTTRAEVVGALDEMWREGLIRHPVGWERNLNSRRRNESEWWRLVSRGETRGEKRRQLFALIGFYPLSLGTYNGAVY